MTKAEQWAESYRSGTDGELKAAIKTFYNMKAWHDLHIALWVWLAMDGERKKSEWFEAFNVPEVRNYCFACEMAEISFYCCPPTKSTSEEEEGCCNYCIKPSCRYYCPLTNSAAEECLNGLYDEWWAADSEQKEKLARKIATMKWEEHEHIIDGQVTGNKADLLVIDDPIKSSSDADSKTKRTL